MKTIDPLAYSEVLRDVDLFASVAGLARRAGWDQPDQADEWVKEKLQKVAAEDYRAAAVEVRRDLLRFHLADAPVEFAGAAVKVKNKKGEFEIDIATGRVRALPARTPVEIKPRKNQDLFLPFEEDDPLTREILAAITHLLAGKV